MACYLLFARLRDVPDSFLLLRDQIRDWRFALGPFSALPLTGTQSTAGGASLGPIYYWILWLSRHIFGPLTDNLPHAGAYGIAALQTATDLLLLDAIRRRTGSTPVALATVLLTATASHDLALTATIWNPMVSVAFVKLAIALRLRAPERASHWWTAGTMAAAWLAVQAHSSAVFVAFPVAASFVLPDLRRMRVAAALQQVRTIVEVIVLLQLPYLVHLLTTTAEAVPTRALAGAGQALSSPGGYRLVDSVQALVLFLARILFVPRTAAWSWRLLLVGCAVVLLIRARRDLALLSATLLPLVFAALGFALWQGNYDEYWYLPLAPAAALVVVLALTWWRPSVTALLAVVAIVAAQPARLQHSRTWYRMPEYRALTVGARAILRQTPTIRRVETTFRMPPLSNAAFPFVAMGGQVEDAAAFDAVIDEGGSVRFRPVVR